MKTSIRFRYAVRVEHGEIVPAYIYGPVPGTISCIGFDRKWMVDSEWRVQCGIAIMKAAKKRGVKIK